MTKRILLLLALSLPGCAVDSEEYFSASCPGIVNPNHPAVVCVDGHWHLYCGASALDCTDPSEPTCITSASPRYCAANPD